MDALAVAQHSRQRLNAFMGEYDDYVNNKFEVHRQLVNDTQEKEIALQGTRIEIEERQTRMRETIASRLYEELRAMKLEIDNEMLRLQYLDQSWDFERVQKVLEMSRAEDAPIGGVLRNVYLEAGDTIEERETKLADVVKRHGQVVWNKEAEWRKIDETLLQALGDLHFQAAEKLIETHAEEQRFMDSVADYLKCRREYLILEKTYHEEVETLRACNGEMKKTLEEWEKTDQENTKEVTQNTKKEADLRYRKAQEKEIKCRKQQKTVETALAKCRSTTADKTDYCATELDRLKTKCQRLKRHRGLALQGLQTDASFLRQKLKVINEFIQQRS
eukprot:GEMP01047279.1.p1 GENE.GEMP01047279.1~~GEMP01047279.1.p1  ORF type:complete len:353 (+),score=79.94 GEMP01047279.1:65-1060(+)